MCRLPPEVLGRLILGTTVWRRYWTMVQYLPDGLAADDSRDCVTCHKLLTLVMTDKIREYLAEIGRRGGQKSRRTLDPETARSMVRVREARRAYRRFRTSCFWSYRPDLHIGLGDVDWVAETLMRNGNREAWKVGRSLCL